MNEAAFLKKGFYISTDKGLLNFELIYNYLDKESYWSKGIEIVKLKNAIENSMCFGVYSDKELQVGFARVVTDQATFAYICDVFIISQYRSFGLSKWLIQTILKHPSLQGLRRWLLATADAHGLYSQFGFIQVNRPDRWMEIFTPYDSLTKEGKK